MGREDPLGLLEMQPFRPSLTPFPLNHHDLVFIDGAHDYPSVKADIANARRLAKPGATVVVNSLTPWFTWGIGPTTAWDDAVGDGIVTPLEYLSNALAVSRIHGPVARAWAVGQFQQANARHVGGEVLTAKAQERQH